MERTIWAEIPLEDDLELPQFNRKVIVIGIDFPENKESIHIKLKLIYFDKNTGELVIEQDLPYINLFNEESKKFKRKVFSEMNMALAETIKNQKYE